MIDVAEIFGLQAGVVEMLVRGTTIYWVLYALLRVSGRRDLGPTCASGQAGRCVIWKRLYLYWGRSPIVAPGIFFPCTSRTYIEDRNRYREVVQQRQRLRLYLAGTWW